MNKKRIGYIILSYILMFATILGISFYVKAETPIKYVGLIGYGMLGYIYGEWSALKYRNETK